MNQPENDRRERWNERYAAKALVWSAGPNRLLEAELSGRPAERNSPRTALDVACGEGRNALWLAEQGWQVTAIDFSAVAIEKARQISEHRGLSVNWITADVSREPLPATPYDLVCILYFHTDPEERARWLPAMIDAVGPGGTFIYIGHDPSNIEHGVGGPQQAELLPDCAELTNALQGFRIDTATVVERPVGADPGHGSNQGGTALDTFVRAVRIQ